MFAHLEELVLGLEIWVAFVQGPISSIS